jgi:hypothetical protein
MLEELMKRFGILVLAAVSILTAAACDDDPAGPSALPMVFTANMRATNETAAVTGPEASGIGAATVTLHVTRDSSNTITGGTVDMYFQLASLPSTTSIRLAHIHIGPANVAGPVVVDTGLTPATAFNVNSNGTAEFNVTGVTASAALLNQIVANPAGYYFNVHSALHGAGVVRGQLVRIQ